MRFIRRFYTVKSFGALKALAVILPFAAFVALAALGSIIAGCNPGQRAGQGNVRVVAGIQPYSDIVQQIGGAHVSVITMIPPGKNPHSFDLDPRKMSEINQADLAVFNGAGLEMWAESIAESMHGGNARILWISELVKDSLLEETGHEGHGHEGHGGVNPHFWLDPILMKSVVAAIRDSLCILDPKHSDEFRASANAIILSLDSLDRAIRASVQQWSRNAFVTTHAAWSYFCKRYGIREAGILEVAPGSELSAKSLATMANMMQKERIEVIFSQRLFPNAVAHALAEETGATLAELDPHGNPGDDTSYLGLMKYNFSIMDKLMR